MKMVLFRLPTPSFLVVLVCFSYFIRINDAFVISGSACGNICRITNRIQQGSFLTVVSSSSQQNTDDTVTAMYDEEDDESENDFRRPVKNSRWHSLNPKIKQRIIEKGQQRAIANKKKREPIQDKKRRMMMFFKKKQKQKRFDSKVTRPTSLNERTPLEKFAPGTEVNGTVISLTNFGAYIDIGTECDGLLHISQISNTYFVEHPRQVLTPGDEVTVTIRSTNPELKKLHLTMLPYDENEVEEEQKRKLSNDDYIDDRIHLEDLQVDDELWGELKRVTDFGAYVEVGAVVDGFLHFMDHPSWGYLKMKKGNDRNDDSPPHPSEFMSVNDRVRVWVSNIDLEKNRIKLTAIRPADLPGPRREVTF